MKDAGGVNGTAAVEDDGDQQMDHKPPNIPGTGARTSSPHVRGLENGITASLNGMQSASPPKYVPAHTARDSFLNYFFSKEGMPSVGPLPHPTSAQIRHATSMEPTLSHNMRRGEPKSPSIIQDEFNAQFDHGGEGSLFVSRFLFRLAFQDS